jgi:hypothetical protein
MQEAFSAPAIVTAKAVQPSALYAQDVVAQVLMLVMVLMAVSPSSLRI